MYEKLELFGFTKNQAKVYLANLELGSCSAVTIAKHAELDKSNTYQALNSLVNKGYVSKTISNCAIYTANKPDLIKDNFKANQSQLQSELGLILPKLNAISDYNKDSAAIISVTHRKGVKSFTLLLNEFLDCNDDILVYGIPKIAREKMKYAIIHFHKERLKKKILMKHIYNFAAEERVLELNEWNHTEAKIFSKNSFVSTNICGDNVVIVDWKTEEIIHIRNKVVADSYKEQFNLIWDLI